MKYEHLPHQQGLYDPRFEHDSCGVGFLCNIKGKQSHRIVQDGLNILKRLAHRGATGADPLTGDGAGILIQTPHAFFKKVASAAKISLPVPGDYGTGLIFLPSDPAEYRFCKKIFEDAVAKDGHALLGWRKVPVDNDHIGKTARETEPVIEQVFIGKSSSLKDSAAFERRLYAVRKHIEHVVRASTIKQIHYFYVTNLSCRTFIYKGLLMPEQVEKYFLDLQDPAMVTAIALVHSRYSTNTFPTWDLAQPFRFLAHNGEINTLRGNINWMRSKEGLLHSDLWGDDIESLKPIIMSGGSDSAMLDNVFELLVLSGRSLSQAMMMLVPPAWEHNNLMPRAQKDFYTYHACMMEPWDGPAALAFTDGKQVGAVLDRNGLRPARYVVTKNDMVAMASEAGVLDIPPEMIAYSGRLEPGKTFFIDTEKGCIIDDGEVKKVAAETHPYGQWLKDNLIDFAAVPAGKAPQTCADMVTELKAFGYTREDLKVIIKPMVDTEQEPIGSMGNDTPHAVLSQRPQLLYSYFKQLFAQVTNPPIDSIREELVMSLFTYVGPEKNLLDESPEHCRKIKINKPVLTNEELEKLRAIGVGGFKTTVVSTLFSVADEQDFLHTVDRICHASVQAIKDGFTSIILSDRGISAGRAALPALIAVGAVHQHLVRESCRAQISIIVESGEPREVHHFGLLFGFGADCINPYAAYDAIRFLIGEKQITIDEKTAISHFIKAVDKGILKILSRMGISTLQSYRGAQIFEALGLHDAVIERCFTGTVSRIGGADFAVIAAETLMRHRAAFPAVKADAPYLPTGGVYQWAKDGEFHLWNPDSISALQDAVRRGDEKRYREFAALINDQSANPTTLRSLLKFRKTNPLALDQVEPFSDIVKRFATGAMSFGSISKNTHETIAIAMNRLKAKSNTGEGGEDPARFVPMENGDSKRSAIKQVASGRFGVTTNYLVNADEIQIKMAQGAKPGEGGQLPGHKVSEIIARTRYTTTGVTLISPPPHHDIYSIEDLAQLIFDLKNANPRARISVKLVSEIGVGTIAAGVAKGHADMILISGFDGGTGASPLSSVKNAGLPWELGLSEAHQTLVLNDLRSRVRLQTDGQMRTGRDVAIAALLGAEEFGFCTVILIILGCVMLRHCHLNNCSVGVATQDDVLEKRFAGNADHIIAYFTFLVRELREIMAQLGVRTIDEMVGRTDLLEVNTAILPWKARNIDFSKILYKPAVDASVGLYKTMEQNHSIDDILDRKLIELAGPALTSRIAVTVSLPIANHNRTTGTMLSGRVCAAYGDAGLSDNTIYCKFTGVAGQSFGAFLARGVSFELEGMANDYVGKGISGGRIIIYPSKKTDYDAAENIIIGNTSFYGAIAGEAYIRGRAGERFCIRNSGLRTVVEGVGDHGCEYMTGGVVVVLGPTGRNFAAGMSGGAAYVYDERGDFKDTCNKSMVEFDLLEPADTAILFQLLTTHARVTGSTRAAKILEDFDALVKTFVKVMPTEYKKILHAQKVIETQELSEPSDG